MYIFDAHSDIWMRNTNERRLGNNDYFVKTHFPKLKEGKIGGAIFVIYTKTQAEFDRTRYFWRDIGNVCQEIFDFKKNNIPISFVKNYNDILEAQDKGDFFVLMGIEGLSGINGDTSQLYTLYNLGFRHASLTWNEENSFASGAAVEDDNKGITLCGEKAIRTMEELGMILDVSHLNRRSFWDVVEIAKKPFIASHSNSDTLCKHPRNITDSQAKAIASSGGVIGVNACGEFLHKTAPTIDSYIHHIEHFVRITDIESVGLGFDFCDFLSPEQIDSNHDEFEVEVEGLENVKYSRDVLVRLRRRGFSQRDIEKIAYGNFLRVIKEVV